MVRKGRGKPESVPREPRSVASLADTVSKKILDAFAKSDEMLAQQGVPHMLIGGLAVGAWGHPRATKDVDYLVRESDAFVAHAGGLVTFKPNVPIALESVPIDYLTAEEYGLQDLFERNVSIVPIEALFLLKLSAWRLQDRADLKALLEGGADVIRVRAFLTDRNRAIELERLSELERP